MIGLPFDMPTPRAQGRHSPSDQIQIERKLPKGHFHGLTMELFSLSRDMVPQNPVGEFLLTDPKGRRIGTDPARNMNYKQIPLSSYGQGDTDAPVRQLDIPEPLDGLYLLQVHGTTAGTYSLYMIPTDENAESPNQPRLNNIPISQGAVHLYKLQYTRTPGVPMKVWGGFDGGGEAPSGVNELLTYANPIAPQTAIRFTKSPFSLVILYDSAISPATFKATLNGADISKRFKPVPGGYQVVPLKLASGSHTLGLSVQGKTAGGQPIIDADRLEFTVR
jgi:hypothetical protein